MILCDMIVELSDHPLRVVFLFCLYVVKILLAKNYGDETMKHSRAALGVLKNRYISVLKKCTLINTAFLLMVSPAAAVDVGDEWTDSQKWNAFYNAVTEGTDPIINFADDVTRTIFNSNNITDINSSFSELTINGKDYNLTGHTLTTSGETGPITIGKNQTLNINNLNQSYFTQFLNNSGTVNINDGSINNNHAQAIYNNGTLTITGTEIYENTTGISNTNGGTVNINSSSVHNNSGIAFTNDGGTLTITGTEIYENTTGISNTNGGTVNINNSTIQNNRNDNEDTGAGIYNDGGTVNVVSSVFADNYVDGAGAAINNKNGHIVIEDSLFSGNESATNGGAIDTWNNNGVSATIINSIFENNHANPDLNTDGEGGYTYTGGAITNGGGTINILAVDSEHSTNSTNGNGNTVFTGNYVGDGDERVSNALANVGTVNLNANAGHSIIFNDKIDYRNDSTDRANRIININQGDVSVQDAAGNDIALTNDGTIEINNTVSNQTVNLYNGTLKFGYYDGVEDWQNGIGGLDNASTDFNIHGGTISLQDGIGRYETVSGPVNGGPVQWGENTTLHSDFNLAIDAITEGKENGHDVGADMFQTGSLKDDSEGNDHKIILSDINLGANTKYNGTAVTLERDVWDKIVADENTKLQSTAEGFANKNHLTAWNKDTGILKVGDFTLQDAVEETSGERHYTLNSTENVTEDLGEMLDTGSLTIAGNGKDIIANSTTPDRLGGIGVCTGDTLTINDVAAMQGFDTALNVTGGTVSVNNSGLTGNTTALNVTDGTVSLDNSDITNNATGINVADSGSVTMTGGKIANNTTAGLSVSGGSATVSGAEISGNATGLNVSGGTVEIKDNTSLTGNTTGITVADSGSVTMTGGKIANNTTAGLSVSGGSATVSGAEISGNATGINVSGGKVTINNSQISDNKTTGNGGGLNISGGEVNIVGSTISNNSGNHGGGLNISGTDTKVTLINTNITGNTADGIGAGMVIRPGNENGEATVYMSGGKISKNENSKEGTAIDNYGNVTLVNAEISDNTQGGSFSIIRNLGTMALIDTDVINNIGGVSLKNWKEQVLTVAALSKDVAIDNKGTNGSQSQITNGGTINLNAAAEKNLTIADSITQMNPDATSVININGTIAVDTDNDGTADTNQGMTGTVNLAEVATSTVNVHNGTANLQGNVIGTELNQSGGTLNLGTEGKEISLAGSTLNSGKANLIADAVTGGADGAFTIAEKAALNTAQNATIAASIKGSGTINNTGGELNFDADNGATGADFTGAINATAGTIKLGADYRLNAAADINLSNSTLDYKAVNKDTLSNDTLFDLTLNGNATANITGTGRDSSEITLADKFWTMGENTTGNTLNFNNAHYTLATGFSTDGDTVRFDNADISLRGTDYANSNLTLNDSALQLSNRKAGDEYKFGNLISEKDSAEITLDVNLAYDADVVDSNPVADTIEYADGSSGLLNITELFITDDNGALGQAGEEGKIIQVLKGDGDLQLKPRDDMEILSWATNVYEYGVDSTKTDNEADSIKIAVDRPSSTDTLRDLNRYNINNNGEDVNHNRGFSFITGVDGEGKPIANEYHIYRDLDTTAAGNFTILGRVEKGIKSVLSGELEALTISEDSGRYNELSRPTSGGMGVIGWETYYQYKDADGNIEVGNISADKVSKENGDITFAVGAMGNDSGEDARGSMFELVNATNLKISNVRVEEALRTGTETSGIHDGAAIYANNEDAEVNLENTDFMNNEVKGGNGGAIANIKSAVFNIANAIFSDNEAFVNGGAIYNADEMTLANAEFSGNKAANGGAIYNDTAGTMTIDGATFENNATGTDGKGGAIYNAGTMTFEGKVTLAAGTETASNDIYNTGTLNLNGTTELNSAVTNDETLKVNGSTTLNSTISGTGDMSVNAGGKLALADTATIAQNNLTLAEAVELAVNADQLKISEALNNAGTLTFTGGTNTSAITGEGTLNITGEVTNADTAEIEQNSLKIAEDGRFKTLANLITLTDENAAIQNNGALTFTGGTNNNAVSGSGTTTISGTVTNEAKIEQGSLTIAEKDGRLTTNADNLILADKSITNNGLLTFTGGNNGNKVSGTGMLNINGEVVNKAEIEQGKLEIAEKDDSLTTDAGLLDINEGIDNAGTLTFTGGTNNNAVSGSGTTTISGTVTNKAEIEQGKLEIAEKDDSLTTNAGKLTIANGITNNGTLTFTGGNNGNAVNNTGNLVFNGATANSGAITGAGNTTIQSGTVENTGSITQNGLSIAQNAGLTTDANLITLTGDNAAIQNNGTLTFTGGTNNNAVSGSGSVNISGEVGNKANIGQNVSVADNGELTNSANISGTVTNAGKLENSGTLGSLDNQSGAEADNTGKISGDVTNSGTLTSAAENLQGNIANNDGGTLNLSGTLDKTISGAGTTNINGELAFESNAGIDEGTLNMNDGTLDLSKENTDNDDKSTEHNIGKLTGTGTIKIDGDLSNNNGKSDSLNIAAAGEGTTVKIDSINIFADHISENPDETVSKVMNVITGDGASGVTLELAENMATMTSDYLYEFKVHDTIDGAVEATINKTTAGLSEFIQGKDGADVADTYSMTRDETSYDDEAIGTTAERDDGSKEMNLNMNGHTLSGNENNGITVADGFTLNVNGDNGIVANFDTAFAVDKDGTLNLDNVTFKNNGTDVDNNGTLNLSGSNIIEGGITGTGTTTITGGVTEVVNKITQGNLNIDFGAGLSGSADNLDIKNGIKNEGTISFAGGENKNVISNSGTIDFGKDEEGKTASNAGTITGDKGTVNMAGGSANSGKIEQGTINIAAKGTVTNSGKLDADNLQIGDEATVKNDNGTLSGTITNNGTINNGTVSGNVDNAGTINGSGVSGKLTNTGTITGGTIAAEDGSSNSGTISAALDTAGAFTNAESGRITGDVKVSSGSTFANNGSLANIANSGILNNTGTIAGDVANSGTLDNTGTIGGDVTNNSGATLNSELAAIGGSLTNDGTFNMADASITLDKTIAGSGLTIISGSVTLGDGGFDATQDVTVNSGATLDIGAKTVELDDFTLKGQLNLAISDVDAGSREYEGGKLVVNSANLKGGTMQFTVGKGLLSGKQQTGELAIVDATGSISGDLASVFEKNNLYEITKGEKEGTVIITNIATAEEVITGIGNQNQINTAGGWENAVLDEDSAGGKIQEALNTLVQHDIPEYLEALTNLAPTDSQFRLQTAKEAQNLIGRQIAMRLDRDCPSCKEPFRQTAMWMQALGGYAKQDNRFEAAGFSSYTGGFAIGYDGNVNCDTVVGFGYANTNTDGESHGRDMDVSAHNLFAYGKYQPSEWYLRGAFNYGAAKYDEKSDVAGHNVSAKYDVHYTGLEAAVGYDMANGLTPEFGLRTTYLMPDDYEDSVGQKVNNKDIFAVTAAALLKYRTSFELNGQTVRPNVYAGLTYDLTDDGTDTAVNIGGVNYDIIGKRLPRLGGEAGMALEISHDNMDFSVGYDLGYKEDYISHTGMIKFRYNFN